MATSEQLLVKPNHSEHTLIEHGSFAQADALSAARTKLVVATYNIRYAVGSFLITGSLLRRVGLKRPRRRHALVSRHIRAAVRALTNGARMPPVDVLALQEADRLTARSGHVHVARELAEGMHVHYAHAPFDAPQDEEPVSKQWYLDFEERLLHDDAGATGIAMLSRLPLTDVSRIELPWTECPSRPHLALESKVSLAGRNLYLYNAHIDPHAGHEAQLAQHLAILAQADKREAAVLLGDFNTLSSTSRVHMRGLLEAHGYTTPFADGTATWRAGLIRLHTDWIFVRGVSVIRYGVARGLGVSDHWPVWAELEMKDEGGRDL